MNTAISGTVCVKNKEGIGEAWNTSNKNANLFQSNDDCNVSQKVSVQPIATNTGSPSKVSDVKEINISESTGDRHADQNAGATVDAVLPVTQVRDWDTNLSENTFRQLIETWSKQIGWVAVWDVDKDVPIDSPDHFHGNYKQAVRNLLASTTLTDLSLKPCFYRNNVTRIVRETTKCNLND
ncbi:TcpQ domain-containing protein [Undibacterium oligocarboniphilum]|uniref:TcpQ domain-containing protein n=1 Tax=Undibacterium oligocarboniphilum TaxID=666702 RepID=A0A850QNM8_9BURK|nr:TcpQ domain-containing protein [Undibacterium oligocarboniphilum]MBC3871441.1 TcpQ domain-containing protein [Undibacterium oligocarboniphilum]NVO78983.1 TcpQ domain-containing protein [Undibacterium oligocarboniphilum]